MTMTRPVLIATLATMLIVLIPPIARAQTNPANAPAARTIKVSGHGEAHATPDVAFLNLAIETHAPTAQACASLNADLAQKVVNALQSKLKSKGRVWTGGYTLYPEYEEATPQKKAAIIGYRAENSITVQTGAINLLGGLIDSAIGAGANRINYLNFGLQDDTKARSDAIARASKDAQAQAQALAAALGVRLGPIVNASTVSEVRPAPIPRFGRAYAAVANTATPVESNEVTVPATVSLVYQIQ